MKTRTKATLRSLTEALHRKKGRLLGLQEELERAVRDVEALERTIEILQEKKDNPATPLNPFPQ